jgi:hypothetical protein
MTLMVLLAPSAWYATTATPPGAGIPAALLLVASVAIACSSRRVGFLLPAVGSLGLAVLGVVDKVQVLDAAIQVSPGWCSGHSIQDARCRNVASLDCLVGPKSTVTVSHYAVLEGVVHSVGVVTLGPGAMSRSHTRDGAFGMDVVLHDWTVDRVRRFGGTVTPLASGILGGVEVPEVNFTPRHYVRGVFKHTAERIIVVEGDRDPVFELRMTVHEFAKKNSGAFLIVTIAVDSYSSGNRE